MTDTIQRAKALLETRRNPHSINEMRDACQDAGKMISELLTGHDKLRAQLKAAEERVIKLEGIVERVRRTNAKLAEENRELSGILST